MTKKYQQFWRWFEVKSRVLAAQHITPGLRAELRRRLDDALDARLSTQAIACEVAPTADGSVLTIVPSAADEDVNTRARELLAAAPSIARWQFTSEH